MEDIRLFVVIPAMDELHYLPDTLQDLCLQEVDYPFDIYICVNQPDSYWQMPEKRSICEHNKELLDYLQHFSEYPIHVLNYSSPGKGWQGSKFGVGWARKMLFDHILSIANSNDILISLDADTHIEPSYLQSIADNFAAHPSLPGISVPYYHPLPKDAIRSRAILRYELYMRNYAINLYQIGSPYSFTAIGSAIAVKMWALQKVGGITPMKSGEDFYLMQKLRKMGNISNFNTEMVYPSARFSDRVFFGTGPALIKGSQGKWDSYPIYHHTLFKDIANTYQLLPELYRQDVHTSFLDFIQKQSGKNWKWQNIRDNVTDYEHFVLAFHQKADGLRILQYLRQQQNSHPMTDEEALYDNIKSTKYEIGSTKLDIEGVKPLSELSISQLDILRNLLFEEEMKERRKASEKIFL